MDKKSLVIFLGSMGRGGAERVISLISDYFSKKGWEVWICLLLFNKVDYKLNNNIHIIDLSGKNQSRIKRLPGWIFGIHRLVKEIKPNVILSFAARINIIVQIATLGLNQCIIASERNDPYMDGRSKLIDYLTKLLYPHLNAIIFQTKKAANYFIHLNLNNAYIVPNPINIECLNRSPIKHRIVSVGRLTVQKNQELLIKAFKQILNNFPDSELYIYGEGELREYLESLVQKMGLISKVYMPGNVSNIHELMAKADLFVLSSNYEGLSNALLEALMMGIPCVSTNVAGADEYIKSGENGIIIPIGDVEKLISAVNYIFSHEDKAKKMGKKSIEMSQIFSQEIIINQWYEIISNERFHKNF